MRCHTRRRARCSSFRSAPSGIAYFQGAGVAY
jgi:hypothetical protein